MDAIVNTIKYTMYRRLDKPFLIKDMKILSDGWESEVYSFDLEIVDDQNPKLLELVMRIYEPKNTYMLGDIYYDEFRLIRKLHNKGFGVPKPLYVESFYSLIAKPFLVSERIQGQSLEQVLEGMEISQKEQGLKRFVNILHELHSTTKSNSMDNLILTKWESLIDRYSDFMDKSMYNVHSKIKEKLSSIEPIDTSIIHNDFRPGNILIDKYDNYYVIDWTQGELGDPRYDIAYAIVLMGGHNGNSIQKKLTELFENKYNCSLDSLQAFMDAKIFERMLKMHISFKYGPKTVGYRAGSKVISKESSKHLRFLYDLIFSSYSIPMDAILKSIEIGNTL